MSWWRLLLLILFPAFAGLWIGLRPVPERAPVPPVSASAWGQHTPRPATPLEPSPTVQAEPSSSSYRHPQSVLAGNVRLGERVYIAPFASIRADEAASISIGNESSVQEGAVLKALGDDEGYEVAGKRFAIFVGERVSISSQAQVQSPAWIADDVFVGMQALVMRAHLGAGSALEPGARVIGVEVPAGRYVPAGAVIDTQAAANELPKITEPYDWRDAHRAMVRASTRLADVYSGNAAAAPESK